MQAFHAVLRAVVAFMTVAACGPVLFAQAAPTTKPAGPVPVMAIIPGPPGQADAPSTQPATRPSNIRLNYKDAPLDTVLDHLSEETGLVIIKEGPVDGRVTVLSKQPVSPAEAVTILNAALKSNGFTAILQGRELHVLPRDKAKRSSIPVHFGNDPDGIEMNDELITQVIPIQNVDAVKLLSDLQNLMPQEADRAANEGSNTIIMTDVSSNIYRIVKIIRALDQQEMTNSEMRIVQLKYANAAAAVKLIDTVFKTEAGGGGGPQPGQPMQGPMPPQPGGGGAGGGAHRARGKVNAAADDRTNTIVMTGPAETLKLIDSILKKLDANPVPASDMKAFQLRYASAEDTAKLINSVFKGSEDRNNDFPFFFRSFGQQEESSKVKVTTAFDERTNTLIVTAPAEVMRGIEGLIKTLDANPIAASDIKVYQLKYADSYSASKLVTQIFNPDNDSGNRRFPFFIFVGGPSPSEKGPKITASSDDRTNSLIVTAPTEMFKIIDRIVQQLDSNPATEDTLFIYHLRNAQAQNLEVVLNTLFGNIQNQGQNQNQNQNQQQQQGGPFGQRGNNGPGGGGPGGGNGGNRGLNNNNRLGGNNSRLNNRQNGNNQRQQLSPGSAQAVNEMTGMVFVVADLDTNSLIVTTAAKYEKQVKQIIRELDRPVPQVLIKVLVAEVTHDNSADFGVDFSILNTRSNHLGESFGQVFGRPANGLVVSVVENQLNATLHALAQQNKLDVLSRPYILASDNQQAEIMIGQDVPLITNSYVTDFGQTVNLINYDEVGIILDVTPHINPEGLVILDVAPTISALTSQTVPISNTAAAPVIDMRSAYSRVGIRDGQTIVIGGMMQDQKTSTVNKVPILGDLPLLKYAFSRTQVTKTKTELLIFLTPHVAQQPDTLSPMSEDEQKGTRLTPQAVQPGMFQEHMEGMRRGQRPGTQPTGPIDPVFKPEPTTEPSRNTEPPATQPSVPGQTVRTP